MAQKPPLSQDIHVVLCQAASAEASYWHAGLVEWERLVLIRRSWVVAVATTNCCCFRSCYNLSTSSSVYRNRDSTSPGVMPLGSTWASSLPIATLTASDGILASTSPTNIPFEVCAAWEIQRVAKHWFAAVHRSAGKSRGQPAVFGRTTCLTNGPCHSWGTSR